MSSLNDTTATESSSATRSPRQSRLVKATLSCERFGRADIRIRNVSESGIGGISDFALNQDEQVTVHLPGHPPMQGIVRWSVDRRFGIETEHPIEIDQLRAANGSSTLSSHDSVEFRIIPPVKGDFRRPPLQLGFENKPTTYPCQEWET